MDLHPSNRPSPRRVRPQVRRYPKGRSGTRSRILPPVFLALAGFSLAGCEGATTEPTGAEARFTAAAAALAADAALEDLIVMDDALPPAAGPAAMAGLPGGLERERTVTFFDGDGNEQDGHDPLTTASIHIVVSVEGEVSRDGFSASVERHRDMWVSGLEGEEETRIWNGEGSGAHERVRVNDEFGERSYEAESAVLVEDVVRSVDREAHPWPLSGTITRTVHITITNGPNGDVTRDRTVVVTFDGSQFADVTVNGEPSHEIDLDARDGRNPLRRRDR